MATEVECTLCASIGQMGSAANKEPDHFANYAYGDGGDDDDDNDDDDDDGDGDVDDDDDEDSDDDTTATTTTTTTTTTRLMKPAKFSKEFSLPPDTWSGKVVRQRLAYSTKITRQI